MRFIVIGTSSGGVRALKILLGGLPAGFQAIVLATIHLSPSSPGYLPQIMSKAGPLPCVHPVQGQQLQRGHVYLAPPDYHMLVNARGSVRLSHGPRENRFRPAVDPLFRSAALAFGPAVIGVILTGYLDDGTAGLMAVKQCGGTTVIQDPADAEAPSMPRSAARHVQIDYMVPIGAMASLLTKLTKETQPAQKRHVMSEKIEIETSIAADDNPLLEQLRSIGDPSVFTCPECHGTLLRIREERLPRFRCHTGHAFTAQTLLAALNESTEDAIWNAVRTLQEEAMLLQHLARHAQDAGQEEEVRSLEEAARQKLQLAGDIRQTVTRPAEGAHEPVAR